MPDRGRQNGSLRIIRIVAKSPERRFRQVFGFTVPASWLYGKVPPKYGFEESSTRLKDSDIPKVFWTATMMLEMPNQVTVSSTSAIQTFDDLTF